MSYDLIVIGGGPGGYTAAIRGAQLGLKVLLVEKEGRLGGTCLHRGCIPSKAYLAAAEMVHVAKRAEKVGIRFGAPVVDFSTLVRSKDEKLKKLSDGLAGLIKGNKVDLISGKGEARLKSAGQVEVGNEVHETRFILLATGTEPVRPASFPFDGQTILTTDELFQIQDLPQSLLVIGGGVSGCEMACAFNLLGSQVVLVELLPEILPQDSIPAARGLRTVLEKRGVKILTGVSVGKIKKEGKGVAAAVLSDGSSVKTDRVLVAIGRKPGADRLGLQSLGIRTEKGFVQVNEWLETSVEGIYAVGDLTGKTQLAHGAMAQAIVAVESIAGHPGAKPMDYSSIPRVTYTIPEVASIGVTEEELKKRGTRYRAGRFSYLANGKALCHEEEEGFVQILSGSEGEQKDKILGAVIFGAHAADLIQEVALVMRNGLPIQTLIETVHAHPTLGEIVHEAAEDTLGMAIHKIGGRYRSPPDTPHL